MPVLGPTAPKWQSSSRPGVSTLSVQSPCPRGGGAQCATLRNSGPRLRLRRSPEAGFELHILFEGSGQCTLGKTKRRKE